jgi:D-aspartate ligase
VETMKGVVVIGGHIQGLGIVRMLGSKKIPVILMDSSSFNITRFSKYCAKFIKMPGDIFESEKKFCDFLKEKNHQYNLQGWVLFPTDDQTVAYLSRNRGELNYYYKIWTPAWDIVECCYNKKLTYMLAKKIGIEIPESYFPKDQNEVRLLSHQIEYPVIIKPAVMHSFYAKTKSKAIIIDKQEDLEEQYRKVTTIIPPSEIIIQEIIPGLPENLFSFGSFFKDGRTIASVMGRRSRQIPMDFGKASTYVELVDMDELRSLSHRLLDAIGYYGLSEVEFKFDARDGSFKLLEINPRTWKWHSISLLNGLNLPYLLYCDINKEDYNKEINNLKTKIDGKWVDIYTDLFVSMKEILMRNMSLHQYFVTMRGKKIFGSLSSDDPLPFIMETLMIPILSRR